MNPIAILGAALIPTVIGFLWYNPKVFGNAWMAAADMTEEKMKSANMLVVFGVSLLLSAMLAVSVHYNVIHQAHLDSLFNGMTDEQTLAYLDNFKATYGDMHRSFKHGVIHGVIMGLFFALPVMGTNALFERKGFKYIAINVGYWTVTLALMGGVICHFV
jgi:hypothetical protein